MRFRSLITALLGLLLSIMGLFISIRGEPMFGIIPLAIGGALILLGWSRSRVANLIFGHLVLVVGCYLLCWGILLLPYSEPKLGHIFGRPLFWGLFSIFGGICAIFHGFCNCVLKRTEDK